MHFCFIHRFFVHYFLLLYRCFWKLSKFRHQLILKEFHSISSMLSFLSSVKAWSMFILIYNYINSFYLFINRIIDSQLREMEGAWLATKWVLVRDYIFSFILLFFTHMVFSLQVKPFKPLQFVHIIWMNGLLWSLPLLLSSCSGLRYFINFLIYLNTN